MVSLKPDRLFHDSAAAPSHLRQTSPQSSRECNGMPNWTPFTFQSLVPGPVLSMVR